MNFRLKNKNYLIREHNNRNVFIPVVVALFFIIIFSLSWTRNILFKVGTPLWTIKNSISSLFLSNVGVLKSKTNLLDENNKLKEQVLVKNKEQALFDLIKKENEDLKNIFDRSKTNQKLLLGTVLVKPFLSTYDTLVIDVGVLDGVKINDRVLADGNIYIGYISEVYEDASKVILYSSPGEKVKVLIGDNNIEKEALGLGSGNFMVETPREIDVKEGDSIVIPSISTNIFGIVEKIEFKESNSFQNILFKNPINIAELKWVEVLLSNKKQ